MEDSDNRPPSTRSRVTAVAPLTVIAVALIGLATWLALSLSRAPTYSEIPGAPDTLWVQSPESPHPRSRVVVCRHPGKDPLRSYHWEYGHAGEDGGSFVVFTYISRTSGRPVIVSGSETGYEATGVQRIASGDDLLVEEFEGTCWWEYARLSKSETLARLDAAGVAIGPRK